MIEQDVFVYYKESPTLSGIMGGTENVYLIQAPSTTIDITKMPWVVIEKTSGSRTKVSQSKIEEVAYLRITVDAGPGQMFKGASVIKECGRLMENYRGALQTAVDVESTISAIRSWAGFSGTYRYQFDATVRYTEPYSRP